MSSPARHVPLVELVRSGLCESVHFGSVVLVDRDGSVVRSLGDVESPMYPRSANKPAQAAGMLRAGLDLRDDADVALSASSHSGEPGHVERARAILRQHGLHEDALRCPPEWPLGGQERHELVARGSGERRITMNCSGKHAAMLATCVQRGWSTEDYLDLKHPLQIALHDAVVELSGEPVAVTSVDGCGAPLFAMSLTGLATMFGRVASAAGGTPERRVADAMRAHPWLVSGTDREDLALMGALPGLLSKIGAEGVLAVGLPDGRAVAMKTSDGGSRARVPVVVAALRAWGLHNDALDQCAEQRVLGGEGALIGTVRVFPDLFRDLG